MKRGEIWWAELSKHSGRRPVLLLSRDRAIEMRQNVTVAEITTTLRHIPSEVPLHKSDGMPKECVVNLDVINTISKNWLLSKITELSHAKLQVIERTLKYVLNYHDRTSADLRLWLK